MREPHESIRVFNESGLIPGWIVGLVPPHGLSASLVIRGTYELVPDAPATLVEKQPELSGDVPDPEAKGAIRYSLDLVPVKPFTDLLMVGSARPPGTEPATVVPVTLELGTLKKTLFVVGERRMTRSLIGGSVDGPHPFQSMPLGWGRSFGGRKIGANPVGRGLDTAVAQDGSEYIPLPNILRENELRLPPDGLREPAGFGPIPSDWEFRMEKARRATYDARWVKKEWPAHPADFDWSYFNAAPKDQQIPIGSLKGDEPLLLRHLIEGVPELRSRLPGHRPRWFFRQDREDDNVFIECELNIDTIWIDTDARQLVVLWRGLLPVRSKSLRDIRELLIVREATDSAPGTLAAYETKLAQLKAAADMPPEEAPPIELAPLPPLVMTMDWDKWEADIMKDKAAAEALMKSLEKAPGTPTPMEAAAAALKAEGLPTDILGSRRPDDPVSIAAQIKKAFDGLAKSDPATAKAFGPPPTAEELDVNKIVADAQTEFDAADAEDAEAEEEDDDEEPEWTRERVIEILGTGGRIEEQDLSELDLSELDLSGAVLAGSILEKVKLNGTKLVGANLTAVMFEGANLAGADLSGAQLTDADLTGADLSGAVLGGAVMVRTEAAKATLKGVAFSGVDARGAVFSEATFEGATLTGGNFEGAEFTKATFTGADLRGTRLVQASAYGAVAPGVDFEGSEMTNFRTGEGADLVGARFKRIQADGSIWTGARLDGADFTEARMRDSGFTGASMVAAILITADLRWCRFNEANLERAIALKADLFRAKFEDANLKDADLRGASLYEAEFLDAIVDNTNFQLANLKGTKLG